MHVLAGTVNIGYAHISTPPGLGVFPPGLPATQLVFGQDLDRPPFVFKPKFKEEGGEKKEEDLCVLSLALSINVAVSLFGVTDPLG